MDFKKLKIISKYAVEVELYDDTNIEIVSVDGMYKFYVNGIQKDLELSTKNKIFDYISEEIDQDELKWIISNEDFENIYNKKTFEEICSGYNNDKDLMIDLLKNDLELFIKYEHYDKCIVLKKILDEVNNL